MRLFLKINRILFRKNSGRPHAPYAHEIKTPEAYKVGLLYTTILSLERVIRMSCVRGTLRRPRLTAEDGSLNLS
ncbi:MAG: hypothetical protein ACOX2M_09315 [Fastidiosipilaceae bacterium]|jgi:hypothetical protein